MTWDEVDWLAHYAAASGDDRLVRTIRRARAGSARAARIVARILREGTVD